MVLKEITTEGRVEVDTRACAHARTRRTLVQTLTSAKLCLKTYRYMVPYKNLRTKNSQKAAPSSGNLLTQSNMTTAHTTDAGTGGAGGASVPPIKLLGEQEIHPAPPVFFCTFSNISGDITYIGNRGDRGEHGGEKWVTIQVVKLTYVENPVLSK